MKKKEDSNDHRAHTFRIVGWLIMFIGFLLLFSPLIELLSFIPLIGSFLAFGVAIILGIVAFLLSALFSIITIAIAWLFYRPLLAIGLIGGIILIVGLALFLEKDDDDKKTK